MARTKHTTIRLSEQGDARLVRLALHYGSQVAAMEAALDREIRAVFSPSSNAPDAVLEKVRQHVALALGAIDNEFGRRGEIDSEDDDKIRAAAAWEGEIL